MRLRSFTAPNMSEAIRKLRDEFGDDAIIVSSQFRGPGKGVQVTAAYEHDPLDFQDLVQVLGEEPIALADLAGGNGSRPGNAAVPAAGPDAAIASAGAAPIPADPLAFEHALSGAVARAPRQLRPRQTLAAAEDLARILAWHGVPVRLNERLVLSATAFGLDDPAAALAHALDEAFRFVPVPPTPTRPLVLVGLQGAGKTLACAKLAARAVISGIKVTVISADTMRAGAVAQLSAFVDLLRQPMVTVDSARELERAVERARPGGPVFVDTAGINPFRPQEVAELKALAEAAAGDLVLVAAAGGDPAEAAEIAAIFAEIGARQLIGTRLDSSRRYGAILAAAEDGRLRPANLSIHPYVADGLRPAAAIPLARLLLRDPDDRDLEAAFEKAIE